MSNRTQDYQLEICRNKSYKKVYSGKLSQCFLRVASAFDRCRIRAGDEVVAQFPTREERFPHNQQ